MSKKKAKADKTIRPTLAKWLAQFDRCWWCGYRGKLTVHHMSKQSNGGDTHHLCNRFAACSRCNCGPLDKSDKATLAKSLALKAAYDPDNYDLDKWREIYQGSKNRPALSDVIAASEELGVSARFDVGTFIH